MDNNTARRVISFLLSLVLAVSCVPLHLTAWAATGYCGENLAYEETGMSNTTVTISGTGAMHDYYAIGPENYWDATGKSPWSFEVKTVIIEEGATTIGQNAFYSRYDLASVTIPASVTFIGGGAFGSCSKLTDVYYGGSEADWANVSISASQNTYLLKATIHYNCDIPGGESEPPETSEPTELPEVPETTLPEDAPAANQCGDNAFWTLEGDRYELTLIISGSGDMYDYDSGSYPGWTQSSQKITEIVIEEGITSIGNDVFSTHGKLTDITIPGTVARIGDNAFSHCDSLKKLDLPKSIVSIGDYAFSSCTSLADVYYEGSEADWTAIIVGAGNRHLTRATIHYGEVTGGVSASGTCGGDAYWTLQMDTGVLTISGTGYMTDYQNNGYAPWYDYRDAVQQIVIDEGITSVGDCAFWDFSNVKEVVLPKGLVRIGARAFTTCISLTQIIIPDGVIRIEDYAFNTCKKLMNVNIPDSVTYIGAYAFQHCKSLAEITIPEGITSILHYTFYECTSLTKVTIPASVTSIGAYAFRYCKSLTEITIPNGVTNIGKQTFYGCETLASITIPASVTNVDEYAFYKCAGLTDVFFGGSEEEWAVITIGSSNEPLTNAVIHYGSSGSEDETDPPEEPEAYSDIRYYHGWNQREQRAYFGPDDLYGCLVTEETVADFRENPTLLVGKFVVVEYKITDGQEVLLSMTGVTVGSVTKLTDTQIFIDGVAYNVPESMTVQDGWINQEVLIHFRDVVMALEVLQRKTGYLTSWNSDEQVMRIQSSATATDADDYRLSYLAPKECTTFLEWSVDDDGKTDVTVDYLVGSNQQVFEVLPDVQYREGGFSEKEHGWPLVNWSETFDYPEDYDIPIGEYWAAGGSRVSFGTWDMFINKLCKSWGGNCFGLSLLAVAQYEGWIDLKPYFSHSGDTLNEFGFDSIGYSSDLGGYGFVMYHYEDDVKERHPVVSLIERAHLSQATWKIMAMSKKVRSSDFEWFLEYLNKEDPVPLMLSVGSDFSGKHTLVTETCIKPIYIGNGRYVIPLYDSNAPHAPSELEKPWRFYDYDQSVLLINLKEEKWQYWYNGEVNKNGEWFTVHILDKDVASYFEERFTIEPEKVTMLYEALPEDFVIFREDPETETRTKVFEILDGIPTMYCEDGDHRPYYGAAEEVADTAQGIITLPMGNYVIRSAGKTYVQCMYDNEIFIVGTDKGIEVLLDTQRDELTASAMHDETDFACIHASSEVDVSTGVASVISAETSVVLAADSETKTASVSTNADPASLTVIHVVDGEEIDVRPDVIHQHKDLIHVDAVVPRCEIPGNVEHYLCSCGEYFADADASVMLETVQIPALEHIWEAVDALTKVCKTCGKTWAGYAVYLDSAQVGEAKSVWVDGVEYALTTEGDRCVVMLEQTTATNLVVYTFNDPNAEDVHTQYPIGMKVWILKFDGTAYTATYVPEFDNLLQYSGSSIRIVGVKGIRMITSIDKNTKNALTGKGLAGYTLVEYGTALAWASEIENGLVLGQAYTKSNYAYKKDVADPVFATTKTHIQYTNVLVGFNDDQCIPDIAMRPYIILADADGNQVTVYGGIVYRNIGYIAYQNRSAFKPGSSSYNYVWGIIHHVYGDQFDSDYKG